MTQPALAEGQRSCQPGQRSCQPWPLVLTCSHGHIESSLSSITLYRFV